MTYLPLRPAGYVVGRASPTRPQPLRCLLSLLSPLATVTSSPKYSGARKLAFPSTNILHFAGTDVVEPDSGCGPFSLGLCCCPCHRYRLGHHG